MNKKPNASKPLSAPVIAAQIEGLIAKLRKVAIEPIAINVTEKVDIEIRPAADDARITVGHSEWGFTTVNYTSEGLIVDICTDAGDTHTSVGANSEDLKTLP